MFLRRRVAELEDEVKRLRDKLYQLERELGAIGSHTGLIYIPEIPAQRPTWRKRYNHEV